MPSLRSGFALGCTIGLAIGFAGGAAAERPNVLTAMAPGEIWDVVGVKIDTTATRTQAFGINDPRLVGRRFKFSRNRIDTNADEGGCERPRYVDAQPTPGGASGAGLPTAAARLGDYGITLPVAAMVSTVRIFCRPNLGGGVYDDGTPFMRTGPTTALLGWNDLAILELRLRDRRSVARPSFDCRQAVSATERAICGSIDLANIDASMAKAYAGALRAMVDYEPEQRERLRLDQREWLARRSDCRGRLQCLSTSYARRIRDIVAMQNGAR